jgi:RNA polymerase sigma-70 factor (ECF subfamily)
MTCTTLSTFEIDVIKQIPAMRRFARRFCRSTEDVDDLVQDTILRALTAVDTFKPGTNLKSWMFTILKNLYLTRIAKDKRLVTGIEDFEQFMSHVKPSQEWHMRYKEFEIALGELPKFGRDAVNYVLIDGDSYEDAAEKCGCALGTVKSRVNRARRYLATRLGESIETAALV